MQRSGRLKKQKVLYSQREAGQSYNTYGRIETITSGSTTSYTIPNLGNGTEYMVRVTATRTGVSDGPPSAEVTGTPTATP